MKEKIYKDYLILKNSNVLSDEQIFENLAVKYNSSVEVIKNTVDIKPSNSIFTFKDSTKKIIEYKPVQYDNLKLMDKYFESLDRPYEDLKNLKAESLSILEKINVNDNVSEFCIKGLVIGDIQSGKTSSMISLILGAFDIGYETVIVLSGLIENLRDQTGSRVNEGMGIDKNDIETLIKMKKEGITNQTYDKDVNLDSISHYKMNETEKTYWIIKKTANKLEVINKIFTNYNEDAQKALEANKQSTLANKLNKKVLIIDDEADLASQDNSSCKSPVVSRTNELVISLLKQFKKVALVSYTATPFANLLTDKNRTHAGETLFPDNFISLLSSGINYTGFQKYSELNSQINNVRFLDEEELLEYKKIKAYKISKDKKFIEIVKIFLVSLAIFKYKELKGEVKTEVFKTMLVNIDVKNISQEILYKEFLEILKFIVSSWNRFEQEEYESIETLLKNHYKYLYDEYTKIPEAEFWTLYKTVSLKCEIITINKDTKKDKPFDQTNINDGEEKIAIAIGGHKLSRGLTIPGLFTTLFYRNTNNFETAMQMCRWFGYRDNYINLTTLFTTPTAWDNFSEMFETYEEFKNEVQIQANSGLTAEQFIIKIAASNSLLPTSRNKMKGAEILWDRWSKTGRNQIYNYKLESDILEKNLDALRDFTRRVSFKKFGQNYVAQGVEYDQVDMFFNKFCFEEKAQEKIEKHRIFFQNNNKLWDVVIKNIRDSYNGQTKINENMTINLSLKQFKWLPIKNENLANVKTVLNIGIENYIVNDGEVVNNNKSNLSERTNPVLFITLNKFKNIVDSDFYTSEKPVVAVAFYNPDEKDILSRSKRVYVNTTTSFFTEEDED